MRLAPLDVLTLYDASQDSANAFSNSRSRAFHEFPVPPRHGRSQLSSFCSIEGAAP